MQSKRNNGVIILIIVLLLPYKKTKVTHRQKFISYNKGLVTILSGLLLLVVNKTADAQNSPNEMVVDGGIGMSLIPYLVDASCSANFSSGTYYNNYVPYTNSSTPAFNGSLDYGIFNEFSLGAGFTYQSCTVNVNGWYNGRTGLLEDVTENINRLNVRLRGTAHWDFSDDHKWELYGGAGIGYSIWTDQNNAHNSNFPSDAPWNVVPGTTRLVSFQGFLGLRSYFTDNFGAHLEVALGSPYFIDLGISFRMGGMPLSMRGDD